MIINFKHVTTIFTNHVSNVIITNQIKLDSTSANKLNMKFVRTSMYLSQYNFNVIYKPGKLHIVFDALSRLPSAANKNTTMNSLNLSTYHDDIESSKKSTHAYNETITIIVNDLKIKITKKYIEDKT